ncbi:hypothetical protein [Fretibacterium sp. OH1220_COT-178]|uniref:hypothetical protein n=1 Tax=Fretibacterium sp. OH1220_COT-178 TaxID=2491047 RepID=UPI001315047A|nr:hypothetical protein [Fretibacterium sp. OH1220_COT-178]
MRVGRLVLKAFWALAMVLAVATCAVAAQVWVSSPDPILITQPAYAGMQFYVYRPYNIPSGWYATYDGYPVFRNADGIWVYGSCVGTSIVPTAYIVGSVVPSVAGLVPWVPAPVCAPVVSPVPVVRTAVAPVAAVAPVVPVAPVAVMTPVYVPCWVRNPNFVAIGGWGRSVDRIGVLSKPAVPVAWKGRRPDVIYAWTGRSWYQIDLDEWESPVDVLRGKLYELTCMSNRNNLVWTDQDMNVLAQHAALWGYRWMGQIVPAR